VRIGLFVSLDEANVGVKEHQMSAALQQPNNLGKIVMVKKLGRMVE